MHPEARAELRRFRKEQGAIGSALLLPHAPQEQRPDQPVSRHLVAWWLKEAFRRGKLQKPDGSLWPTFRRVWATERKQVGGSSGPEPGRTADAARVAVDVGEDLVRTDVLARAWRAGEEGLDAAGLAAVARGRAASGARGGVVGGFGAGLGKRAGRPDRRADRRRARLCLTPLHAN